MAAQPPYLPAPDAGFATRLQNFATLLAASPTTYGLTSGDATIVTGLNTTFQAAYTAAIDPMTRTPVTVAAKNSARAAAEATARQYAVQISRNPGVTNSDKTAIGVSLPASPPTPVPAPTTNPTVDLVQATSLQHVLSIRDVTTPTSKAKPPGVIGAEIWTAVGVAPAVSPTTATLRQTSTKTPTRVSFDSADRGKICTYFIRWNTRGGPGGVAQVGPWSPPTSFVIL
jgi:hypothetical protein